MSRTAKILLSLGVVLGIVAYLIVSTVRSGEALVYYKHVDEVMSDVAAQKGRKLQLHGNVVQGSILNKAGTMAFRFALHKNGVWTDVSFTGLVPDAFKDCAEVVVMGSFSGQRLFQASSITAKCPSKYEGKMRKVGCGEALLAKVSAYRKGDIRSE